MTDGTAAIEIDSLSKTYGKGSAATRAVNGVSLIVPPGQVFSLLGPNGAGKTTTIKLICGLLTPTAGSVRLNGFDVGRQRSRAVLQLGAVLEGGRNVYWSLSAWQNLLYFGRLKGLAGDEIRPRAQRLLRDLGLWEVRHAEVGTFSRGMQQKVAVAAALITDPPILLLDEPTIGLDVEAARTVREWVTKLAHEDGKTIVLTTHQLEMAQVLSDRVAIMRMGRIVADMPVQELLSRFRDDRYRIVVGAHSDLYGMRLPAGSTVTHEDGATVVTSPALDDHGLYALLDQLQERELPLRALSPVEPDLEEVFLELVRNG
jgi:ABC-2 type transport system ATP-binding protein